MPYGFEREEALPAAFHRTAREQLDGAETALTAEFPADPGTAVHSARKAIKKERSLLRLMRGSVRKRDRRRANAALRDAGRRLSGARDAAVMLATLDELADRYAGQVPHTAFDAVRERLRLSLHTVDGASVVVSAREAAAGLAAVRERVAEWELRREDWRAIEDGLTISYRRGIDAMQQARRHPEMESLHEWRKRAKDHWYHLRLLTPICGETVRGEAAEAEILCDLLGLDHDLAVLRETLVGTGTDVPADVDAVLGLLDHRRAQIQAEAFATGERVYAERPKAFTRRMRRYYGAGREQRREALRHGPAELAEATRAVVA